MSEQNLPLIDVVGATGNQGDSTLRALQADSLFRTRALTRNLATVACLKAIAVASPDRTKTSHR